MTQEIIYSHRPAAGVSVAATNDGQRLLVAFALVNDGTSRNGVLWRERRDAFSRTTARQILNGRLQRAAKLPVGTVPMTIVFDNGIDARRFMAELRQSFKPTPDESDTVFCSIDDFGGVEIRYRQRAEDILEAVSHMANEVVADASARITSTTEDDLPF